MTFDIQQAGIASSHHAKEDLPTIFLCKDFPPGVCCEDCHRKGYVIAVYPWSSIHKSAPDLSLGLRAEICCARFNSVRDLPRSWWIQRYGEKHGWNAADIKRLVEAPPEAYYKLSGEIASGNYVRENPGAAPRIAAPRRPAARGKGCPKCGGSWDGIVCDNCGHSG